MPTWNLQSNYVPSGGPVAPSAAPGSIGGGWVDFTGSRWGIDGGSPNLLYSNSSGAFAAPWIDVALLRPTSDNPADFAQQLRQDFLYTAQLNFWFLFRAINMGSSTTQAGYLIGLNGGTLAAFSYSAGTTLVALTASGSPAQPTPVEATGYYAVASVVQTDSTTQTLQIQLFNTSDVQQGGTFSFADTTAALRNLNGRCGVFRSRNSGSFGTTGNTSRLAYYNDLANSYTAPASPTTITLGASTTATVTPDAPFTGTIIGTPSGSASTGLSPIGLVFSASATPETATWTPTVAGTLTLTWTNNGSLTNPSPDTVTVNPAPATFYADNASLFFAPYSVKKTGSGSSARADATLPGDFLHAVLNGATTTLGLLVDGTANNGATAGATPVIAWSLNKGPIATHQLSNSTNAIYTVDLTSGSGTLTGTGDTLRVWFKAGSIADDLSASTKDHLVIQGLTADSGATLGTYTPKALRYLFYGDSITEGVGADALFTGWTDLSHNTSYEAWAAVLADTRGAEYGQVACGGLAMGTAYSNQLAPCTTSWKYYSNTDSRLVSGLLSPAADVILCNHGTNDTSDPSSAYAAWLTAVRAAAPSALICAVVPINGRWKAQITAVVAAAVAGGDAKVHLIDPSAFFAGFANLATPATAYTYDGVHPTALGQARLAAFVDAQLDAILGSGPSATSYALTAPSPASGFVLNASGSFTLQANGTPSTPLVVTPSDGAAGTFSPSTVTISDALAHAFAYTPATAGSKTISATHTGGTGVSGDPSSVAYTANARTLSVAPATVNASSAGSLAILGGGTKWLSTAPTFGVAGVSGFSLGSVTVASDTACTAPYAAGGATGTATLTDSTTGATATLTVASAGLAAWQTGVPAGTAGFATGLVGGATPGFGYKVALDGGAFGSLVTSGIVESTPGSYSALASVAAGSIPRFRWLSASGGDYTDLKPIALPGAGGGGGTLSFPVPLPAGSINRAAFAADVTADGTMRAPSSGGVVHLDAADRVANGAGGTVTVNQYLQVVSGTGLGGPLIPVATVSGASGSRDGTLVAGTPDPGLDRTTVYAWTGIPTTVSASGGGGGGTGVTLDAGTVLPSPPPTPSTFWASADGLPGASGAYTGMAAIFQAAGKGRARRGIAQHSIVGGVHYFVLAAPGPGPVLPAAPAAGDRFVIG